MRVLLTLALVVLLAALWAQNDPLPTCYYTYAQISQMLTDFQTANPDIAKKVQIGVTTQEQLPIYAMRISDNVDNDEEEPAVLFIGQVHAEEVLGVQITMSNIAEILASRYMQPYSQWINLLDIWFIPTLNPEGHNVVTSNLDVSYRKNKKDVNGNGIFDFNPLTGYDLDGVDINRNFEFNWAHGDTLQQPPTVEVPEAWDYYKGTASMSESENQALKALTDQHPFVYAINWHSSRTGNLSEKVYFPFNWKEVRPSPDLSFAQSIAAGVAGQIATQDGGGNYEYLPNLSRKGTFHDWMYQQYGTMAMLIECGTRNIQPDSLLMVNTVQRCSNGVRWLLNRALPSSSGTISTSMLTGTIRDAVTNAPLQAEIIIQGRQAPWMRPRLSNAVTGRYFRPLPTASYTVQVKKRGYFDTVTPNVMVNNLSWTIRNFTLQPKTAVVFSGTVRSGNMPLNAEIKISDPDPIVLQVNGDFVYSSYEGEYPVEIRADGYYPWTGTVNLSTTNSNFNFQLSPAETVFSENWDLAPTGWTIEGNWVLENELSVSGNAMTDSWGGWGFYDMNCDWWIMPSQQIHIPQTASAQLLFDSHLYTEYAYDFARVQVSADSLQWNTLWEKSGQLDHFNHEYVSLDDYRGQNIWLRFRLTDQSTNVDLTDPGWTLDNISILTGTSSPTDDPLPPYPTRVALYPSYPNPFNPSTTINFSLAAPGTVRLGIYNIKGQLVKNLVDGAEPAGDYHIIWDGKDSAGRKVASGLYLYRLESGSYSKTLKMMLAK